MKVLHTAKSKGRRLFYSSGTKRLVSAFKLCNKSIRDKKLFINSVYKC